MLFLLTVPPLGVRGRLRRREIGVEGSVKRAGSGEKGIEVFVAG